MSTFHEKYQGNFIHFADFKQLFKKKRIRIISFGFFTAALAFFLTISLAPKYVLKGCFKEAQQKGEGFANSFVKNLLKGSSHVDLGAQAQSLMLSRELLLQVIDELSLQGEVKESSLSETLQSRWRKNLSLIAKRPYKNRSPISFSKVVYLGAQPRTLFLEFLTKDHVKVFRADGSVVCNQPLKEIFAFKDLMFAFSPLMEEMPSGHLCKLVFYPKQMSVDRALQRLSVKVRKDDASILDITYKDTDPFRGARFLNTLMHNYKQYLVRENERIAKAQLQYLTDRQDFLSAKLEDTLKEHVAYLQKTLGEKGFVGLQQELQVVEEKKRRHHERILEIDLNIDKLSRIREQSLLCLHDSSLGEEISSFQTALFGLKKQKDTFDLNSILRTKSKRKKGVERKKGFAYLTAQKQSSCYFQNQEKLEELEEEARMLEQKALLPVFSKMKKGLHEMYRCKDELEVSQEIEFDFDGVEKELESIERLKQQITNLLSAKEFEEARFERASFRTGDKILEDAHVPSFTKDSLLRINHLLNLKESILKKALYTTDEIPQEFVNLDLDTAKKLFIEYSKELDEVVLQEKRLRYSYCSIGKKEFEVSSLTSILDDTISADNLARAARISLELTNEKHLSEKDKKRLEVNLEREKSTLSSHIKEMLHLAFVQKELLQQKIGSLQSLMSSLVNQEIVLIENQIDSSIEERLQSLRIERAEVSRRLEAMQADMKDLPNKWLLENKLQLKSDLNIGMMEALSHLVESKNVEHHLLQIESKPIDHAYAPLKPKQPPVFLLSTIAGFLGAFVCMGALSLSRVTKNKLPVSLEGLSYRDCKIAGKFSKPFDKVDFASLTEKDLQVLRKVSQFVLSSESKTIGACLGNQPTYVPALASLLALSKRKTLLIELYHNTPASRVGLLHYLLGKKRELPLQKKGDFHLLSLGEETKYTMELLSRRKFVDLIEDLKDKYEVILLVLDKSASSAEAMKLSELCEKMLITLDAESIDDLYPYFEWEEQKGTKSVMYLGFER